MAWRNLKRTLHHFRWRVSSPLWRRRFARSAGVWALVAMTASAFYVGFMSPMLDGALPGLQGTFHQCWINTYDCGDFGTRSEAQALYMACGGRQNDVHRLDRDRDGWACEPYPQR
jgi:hypothetical protein